MLSSLLQKFLKIPIICFYYSAFIKLFILVTTLVYIQIASRGYIQM